MQKQLLPPGKLWKLIDSVLEKIFLGAADELVRVDGRSSDLVDEWDPRITSELLPEFEQQFVVVVPAGATEDERRAVILSELRRRQRFRPVDFAVALASVLDLATVDVDVRENSRAFAISVSDDRIIYQFFVYRDPGLPGTPDIGAAQALLDRMAPSHTNGDVIESIDFRCDEATSLCDRDILGA